MYLFLILFSTITSIGQLPTQYDTQQSLSRYDMTEFLSITSCGNCLSPDKQTLQKYDQQRRDLANENPNINVEDISQDGSAFFKNQDYSICVAQAIDQGLMSGYPLATSDVCPGKFCGQNTLVTQDFVDTLINLAGNTAWASYSINRQEAKQRASTRTDDFTASDMMTRDDATNRCKNQACSATTKQEFSLLLRYCKRNPKTCGMNPTQNLPTGSSLLAPLHILIDAGYLTRADTQAMSPYDPVSADIFDRILSNISQQKGCAWTIDRDQDGIQDSLDNCPNAYNPRQGNMDNDTKGDVCDEDIDADGILNPIGIIDDEGNIRTELLLGGDRDNCLLIPNTGQGDQDNDSIGDACNQGISPSQGSGSNIQSVRINIISQTDATLVVSPNIEGTPDTIRRDFGDGSPQVISTQTNVSHNYAHAGVYIITLYATYPDGITHIAKRSSEVTTENSDGETKNPRSSQLTIDNTNPVIGQNIQAKIVNTGFDPQDIESVRWSRGDGQTSIFNSLSDESFTQQHARKKAGKRRIGVTITLTDETQFIHEMSILVSGEDICLTNKSTYNCDLDQDDIIDQCDDDIDGDGVENMLGIVVGENETCAFTTDIIDATRLRQQQDLILQGTPRDNCIFGPNPEQKDEDQDSYGDLCDSGRDLGPSDIDQDGIIDEKDACITLPEDFNGIEDKDGCPEITAPTQKTGAIKADNCSQCPCQKADYTAQVRQGDRIKAVLVKPGGDVVYSHSSPRVVTQQ